MSQDAHALDVLEEVYLERERQDAKWGEQNHPNGTGEGALRDLTDAGCSAGAAQGNCERMFAEKRGTFADIFWEEVAEAMEEEDPKKLRKELIQVAAVAVSWIQAIDRKRGAA